MNEFRDREAAERAREERPDSYMRRREFLSRTAALAGLAGLGTVLPADTLMSEAARMQRRAGYPSPRNMPVNHFVVLMMENRSFDHYFGWHPDADGKNHLSYPDDQGDPHPTHRLAPDYQGCGYEDPDHSWEGGRAEYNNGKLDGFLRANDEFAIGYYLKKDLPFIPHAAKAFTLYDRYFCSLLGPTWPNRLYMHSAQCGGHKENGSFEEAGQDFFVGNGLYTWETIWDRMLQKGLKCAYYGSDQPFIGVFGKRMLPINRRIEDYYADAESGNLPHLAFVDPPFLDGGGGDGLSGDEHPHGDIRIGQSFMSDVVHAFLESPNFHRGAFFINYDEWGGFFDHVAPRLVPDDLSSPNLDENFGITGFRSPGVAISPYVRRGHVSHATVTHESILKLVAYRFGLGYLNKRHRYASDIGRTFDWQNPNFDIPDLPAPPPPVTTPCSLQGGGGAAARTAEREARREERREEGLSIGSAPMSNYLDSNGFEVQPATADRIFRYPSKVNEALAAQLSDEADHLARHRAKWAERHLP